MTLGGFTAMWGWVFLVTTGLVWGLKSEERQQSANAGSVPQDTVAVDEEVIVPCMWVGRWGWGWSEGGFCGSVLLVLVWYQRKRFEGCSVLL